MPRTALPVQPISRIGLHPAYSAANAAGHSVPNDGRTFAHVKAGATAVDVTVAVPGTVDGQSVTPRVVHVPANEDRMIGPFAERNYDQADGSGFDVEFSQVVTITVAAIRL